MSRKDFTVAVVVPLLNEEELLAKEIVLLKQLGADEVVLVDGGSDDGSLDILQGSGLNWIASAPGRGVQMNAGAALCGSDIILFKHIDTSIDSSDIEAVHGCFSEPGVVAGRFDISLSQDSKLLGLIAALINLRSRISRISTGDQCIFVRRDIFEHLGGFAEIPLMEDIEFSTRLKRCGRISALRRKVVTSSRRWQQQGIVRTVLLMWKLRLLFWLGVPPKQLAEQYRQVR